MKPVNGPDGRKIYEGTWLADGIEPISGTFGKIYSHEAETYHWMTMKEVSKEQFEETKPYNGCWVTLEFGGGEKAEDSPMDDVTFNRIMMDKHHVKIVLPEDGTEEIHLYKYKKG